jgi:hypothetical protein
VTFLGVPYGTGGRLGIDRDLDGVLDGEERTITLSIHLTMQGEGLELRWNAGPGRPFLVESSETLNPGTWAEQAKGIMAANGTAVFSTIRSNNDQARFYRVRLDLE